MRSILLSGLLFSMVFASTVTQTDWSGGGGVEGPVSDWSNFFWTSDHIDFNGQKLKLTNELIPSLEHTVDSRFFGWKRIYATDIDGDGDADVLGAAKNLDQIAWWENTDGTGINWTRHIVDGDFNGAWSVYSTDLDGDGDVDILGTGHGAYTIAWWENTDGTGTSWIKHTIYGAVDIVRAVSAVDVDGDGDADILAHGEYSSDLSWWENTDGSAENWIEHVVDSGVSSTTSLFSADVDGDGDADILGSVKFSGTINWWENVDGTGTSWTKHEIDVLWERFRSVASADVDGDGDEDILSAAHNADDIIWCENADGSGSSWIEHVVDGDYDGSYSVCSADVDLDGDVDVLGASCESSLITWWENADGTGTSWIEHTVDGAFYGAWSVYSADFDGDGYPDVLGSGLYNGFISWWNIFSYQATGTIESSILDTGGVETWDTFMSSSEIPSGSSVSYQFRSSQDYSDMGAWSDTVYSPDTPLSGILANSTRYLQYKAILERSDPTVSPEVFEVSFSYSPLGIADTEHSWSLLVSENPSHGFFLALVSVPETGMVELFVYDVSGRVVGSVSQEFITGTHSVNFSGLSAGVYFCNMQAEGFASTERVVVLK